MADRSQKIVETEVSMWLLKGILGVLSSGRILSIPQCVT